LNAAVCFSLRQAEEASEFQEENNFSHRSFNFKSGKKSSPVELEPVDVSIAKKKEIQKLLRTISLAFVLLSFRF